MIKDIDELAREIFKCAKEKGWWDRPRNSLELMMLMVCEIAEGAEEVRIDNKPVYIKDGKPEGEAVELIDCIIRILDYFEHKGWSASQIINKKLDYNRTRPYRHGNKKY